jgi:hypothetical protein
MDSITDPNGKYPKALGNVALIESKYLSDLVRETAANFNNSQLIDTLQTLKTALTPFLNTTQLETLQQIIDALKNFDDLITTFTDDFQVNVKIFFSLFSEKNIGLCIEYCSDVHTAIFYVYVGTVKSQSEND